MAHARADIVLRWPALAAVADDPAGQPGTWSAAIADAELQVAASAWADRYDLGVIHLAAHLVMLAHPEVVDPGPIQSESVGGVSRVYATSSTINPGALDRTPAGREFKRLRRGLGLGLMVV